MKPSQTHDWQFVVIEFGPTFFDHYSFYRCRACGLECPCNPEAGDHFRLMSQYVVVETCKGKLLKEALD